MNYTAIVNVLGKLLIVTGSSMVFPVICSLYYGEDDLYAIAITGSITIGLGLLLWGLFRRHHDLNIKDGFFIAVFGWILISAVSGLPFMIHGSIPAFTDAFFEMMSGYTTSGATTTGNNKSKCTFDHGRSYSSSCMLQFYKYINCHC